jgi:hypothetical protein
MSLPENRARQTNGPSRNSSQSTPYGRNCRDCQGLLPLPKADAYCGHLITFGDGLWMWAGRLLRRLERHLLLTHTF